MRIVHPILEKIDLSQQNSSRFLRYFTYLVYFFLYAPVIVVIMLSFTKDKVPQFPMSGFSLEWYSRLIPPNYNEQIVNALFQSLQIAIISAIGAGIVGTLAALAIVRGGFKSRLINTNTLNTLFLAPIVVPWVVTGIAVLTLFSLIGIQGTFLSVVVGHILITLPFVVLVVSSQLYGFNRKLEEAAQNLGASEITTFYEITLPLIAPGVIAGILFAFTLSFDNFTQTFFWVGSDVQTLPIVIYSMIDTGISPAINAIGTIIIVFSALVATAAEVLSSRVFD